MNQRNSANMTQHKVEQLFRIYEDCDTLFRATNNPELKAMRLEKRNSACQKYNDAYTEWQEKSKEIWRTNNLIIKEEND